MILITSDSRTPGPEHNPRMKVRRVMDSKSFILSRRKRGRRKLTNRIVCLVSLKPDYIQTLWSTKTPAINSMQLGYV